MPFEDFVPELFFAPDYWFAVLQIIMIDAVLSGDNAVVIALACRNLPPAQRRRGLLWGVVGAVVLRIVLTSTTALVLGLPWLKLVGGLLLLWIGVKLMVPDAEDGHDIAPADHLWGAVRTVIVADFVMSLDNVVAVAGAAHGDLGLLVFGLVVSIPLIIGSSQVVLHLMERWPLLVVLGAALLGWVAGAMIRSDPALSVVFAALPRWLAMLMPGVGVLVVVGAGGVRTAYRRRAVDRRIE